MDAFSDVLETGEQILVSMGAPSQNLDGVPLGWVHVALTQDRLILAEIFRDEAQGNIRVGTRHAVKRADAQLFRHPKSDVGPARLEIYGLPEAVVLVDLDRPDLFAQLPTFLSAWTAPIGGTGPIALSMDTDSGVRPMPERLTRVPGLMLGLVMGVALGVLILWWLD